jgi:multiple sugar transport system ATP-binding protein
MSQIHIEKLVKNFGDFVAVAESDLTINDGEFFVLLGPSGCGKTTTLRMIAGLEIPTSGKILLDKEDVTFLRASQRDIAFVFQLFALYPHMNVRKNLAFPLKMQKFSKHEIESRINEVAKLLRIEHIINSKVSGLAGGDRQRVALGRAIVRRPKAFLMDEPLGTLDAEFRELMCLELRKLHNNINATTVYVTHDQLEAMSMGDRIAVMNEGKIIQSGPPKEIYSKPKSKFVGSFIGSPAMNFIPINEGIKSGQQNVKIGNIEFAIPKQYQDTNSKNNHLGIRPEKMYLSDDQGIEGEVYGSEYLGSRKILTIQSFFGNFKIRVSNDLNANLGSNVKVNFESKSAIIFDGDTENALKSESIN